MKRTLPRPAQFPNHVCGQRQQLVTDQPSPQGAVGAPHVDRMGVAQQEIGSDYVKWEQRVQHVGARYKGKALDRVVEHGDGRAHARPQFIRLAA
jgi:hypothetical protein